MSQADELMDLLRRQEDLDPELAPYHYEDGKFGACIKHPLVFSIIHGPQMNAFVNAQLRQKKRAVEEAVLESNWESFIWLHERPYRLDAFKAIGDKIDRSKDYWRLLGEIWTDSENIWQNQDDWRDLFEDPERGDIEYFMTDEDRELMKLPPSKGGLTGIFTVYRGFHYEGGEDGFSWTINRQTAEWFARRLIYDDRVPMLAKGTIGRKDVIAWMTGRGENEIVCLPENVHAIEVESLA